MERKIEAEPEAQGRHSLEEGPVVFDCQVTSNQRTDWLHRGDDEPLASMGIYHYSMYVYTCNGDPFKIDPLDSFSFPFAATHPQCRHRVQKLRLSEPFRVPRLFGFTMPSSNDPERQAMFKSILFRALRGCEARDEVRSFMCLVNDCGLFGPV